MDKPVKKLPWLLVAITVVGCQSTPVDDGSLASMKRNQESRLMYECIAENATVVHGGLSLDVIQACQKAADAMVW
jgi:hypothetical protein